MTLKKLEARRREQRGKTWQLPHYILQYPSNTPLRETSDSVLHLPPRVKSRAERVERSLNLPQVLPRQPPHTPLLNAPFPGVAEEIAGVKPRHNAPSIQRPPVTLEEVVVGDPGATYLGYASRFVGKERLG